MQHATEIISVCKRLYERGYVVSKNGNVSCRLDDGKIVITPSCFRKRCLEVKDLCVIDLDGQQIPSSLRDCVTIPSPLVGEGQGEGGRLIPSSEYRVHCAAYRKRKDVKAIVHAHPPYAIVCSLATLSFEYPILPETALSLGAIPTVPYAPPGSEELAKSVGQYITDHNAFILQRHGVVAFGNDLEEAFDRLEEVEHAAKIAYMISLKGRIPVMGRSQLVRMAAFVKEQGIPVPDIAMKLLHRILSK